MAHGALPPTSLRDLFTTKDQKEEKKKENTILNTLDSTFGQRNLCQSFNVSSISCFNKLAIN